jgi:hypothetical protein
MGVLDWNTRNAAKGGTVKKGQAITIDQYNQSRAAARATTQAATERVVARDKIIDAQKYENLQASQKRNAAAAVAQNKLAAAKNDAAAVANSSRPPTPALATQKGRTASVVTGAQLGTQQFPSSRNFAAQSPEVKIASQAPYEDKERLRGSTMTILGKNVLNDYTNYTYNFTLSGLNSSSLKSPTISTFEKDSKEYTVLKSSGKGNDYAMQPLRPPPIIPKPMMDPQQTAAASDSSRRDGANGFIDGFNKNSPGRFDMYIDNVEIDTLLTFSGKAGPTLPIAFRFEVIEPYSINGFLEALQAAALGCGYLNYASASFLLKMNFMGYNEDDTFEPDIKNATRYFGIKITKIQLEVTAKGAKYICVGLPFNEYAFSDEINKLQQSVQFHGSTVSAVLTEFIAQLSFQRNEANKKSHSDNGRSAAGRDEYVFTFGEAEDSSNFFRALRESPVNTLDLKESKIFTFSNNQVSGVKNGYGNTGSIQKDSATQTSRVITFSENSNITDCIAAVISESEWAKNLLKHLELKFDSTTGLVDYFIVRVEVTNLDVFDLISNRPYQKFNYRITPYKIHYTMIPGYQQTKFVYSTTMKKHFLIRQYNYIYTGKNVDILDFKINFNNSLYATMPVGMGVGGLNSLSNADKLDAASYKAHNLGPAERKLAETSRSQGPPTAGNIADGKFNSNYSTVLATGSLSAGPPSQDPYYIQSKAMYEAVVKRPYNMTEVELSILGDPVFLVMGGVSNFNSKSENGVLSENGSLNQNFGTPYIEVTFRNPIDIGESGFLEFQDDNRLPFSGVFMVKKVVSKFSNGLFTQRLQIARMPQSDNEDNKPSVALIEQPLPGRDPTSTGVDTIVRYPPAPINVAPNLRRASLENPDAFEPIPTTRQ